MNRQRVESLLRRLRDASATDAGQEATVLRRVTRAVVDGEPIDVTATVADVDADTGFAILEHLQVHADLRTRTPMRWGPADPDARAEALRALREDWPTTWTTDGLADALRLARRIFQREPRGEVPAA